MESPLLETMGTELLAPCPSTERADCKVSDVLANIWRPCLALAGALRMDWLDLLTVQGTLKHLFQHHSSKASILWHSAFFMVQLSHPYMTTGETIALTRWTFVGKVLSLLFNTLSRF